MVIRQLSVNVVFDCQVVKNNALPSLELLLEVSTYITKLCGVLTCRSDPRVLLLDEATSALDAESEWAVKEAIDNLLKTSDKRSVLIIAHRLSTVQNADEVIVIHKGRVVERGNHSELIARDGVYKKLGKRQAM